MLTTSSSAWHRLFLPGGEPWEQVPPRCTSGPEAPAPLCSGKPGSGGGAGGGAAVAAAQDLPEPAASGEKDQMGLARPLPAGLRPHCPWPVVRPRTLGRPCRREKGLPYPEERPSGNIPGVAREEGSEVGAGGARNILRTQDPEPADWPPLPA